MLMKKCILLGTDSALVSSVFSFLQGSVFGAPQQVVYESASIKIISVSGFVPSMVPNILVCNAVFTENVTEKNQILLESGYAKNQHFIHLVILLMLLQ